jgi:hypothetical protein
MGSAAASQADILLKIPPSGSLRPEADIQHLIT